MAGSNGRWLRPGGVLRALVRLSLLISLPFAAGLLGGVLVEEPELLARHLRGEGESVVLAEGFNVESADEAPRAGSDRQPADVIKDLANERERVMQAPASEELDRVRPVVAAPPVVKPSNSEKTGRWAIQVGAFSDEATAARLVVGLDEKGYPTELIPSTDDSSRWRVRVQPIEGKRNAEEMAGRLKAVERLPTWIIPMEGRPR